ncbi:MAG: hypothetical protein FWC92_02880 [Defluviitaleaceae bacterium]|nr:hypothetical protein [Defluviitaleaceae bacterium]
MIRRKIRVIAMLAIVIIALVLAVPTTQVGAVDNGYAPWLIPMCPNLTLSADGLVGIDDATSAQEAITYAVAAFVQAGCQCDDALNLIAFFIEDAIRKGTTLDAPTNGVFYADMLQISADIARNISENAQGILDDEGISLLRPLNANINFVLGEQAVLDISFPDDVSGMDFDNITIQAQFAAVTFYRGLISGSALRIEPGAPLATGGYDYTAMHYASVDDSSGFVLGVIVDYWAVIAFAIVLIIWGVLASMGKRLRIWVVPVVAVILIVANIWTLGPIQEGPENVFYAPVPVYFYSVNVVVAHDVDAMLSVPMGGANPDMLVLVNESNEPLLSRYNPFTDTVDAYISSGGVYSLRVVDIRG